jgi:CRISPR/Cas system CSM-associated protein Csm3 (group 7 of RAMP superfamily)
MDIKYRIEFHTDWHCGSGLAAGADVDALVVKDKNDLPFIPGKTIKGLLREAIEEIRGFQGKACDAAFVNTFGYFEDKKEEMERGEAFFTNAELHLQEREAIIASKAARFLYRSIASTAIGENGIAKEHSLRKMQVVVPCTLYGEVKDVPESMADELMNAFKYIKRLGQNRNRGLGRCTISVEKGGIQ